MGNLLNEKWDRRFLDLCKTIASWSKDPSTKCGAVIVRPNRTIVSLGYNGFPRDICDTAERLNDRQVKYSLTVHSEMNALHNAPCSVDGFTIYCYPFVACNACTIHLIQAGIKRVVAPLPSGDILSRWASDIKVTKELLKEAGVELTEYDLGVQ